MPVLYQRQIRLLVTERGLIFECKDYNSLATFSWRGARDDSSSSNEEIETISDPINLYFTLKELEYEIHPVTGRSSLCAWMFPTFVFVTTAFTNEMQLQLLNAVKYLPSHILYPVNPLVSSQNRWHILCFIHFIWLHSYYFLCIFEFWTDSWKKHKACENVLSFILYMLSTEQWARSL